MIKNIYKRNYVRKKKNSHAAFTVIAFLTLLVFVTYNIAKRYETSVPVSAQRMLTNNESAGKSVKENSVLSDPLLVLVNADNSIPNDWQVTPCLIDDEIVDMRMYSALTDMIAAAENDGVWFWIASGYRSVELQEEILNRAISENINSGMTDEEAEREALKTIARPGHSEHHTGLAIDFNDVSDDFEQTEAYRWLCENAADYGFVQRYEKDKVEITGIDNESWHYRYVGKEHALKMKSLNMCLEEYIEYLKMQMSNKG